MKIRGEGCFEKEPHFTAIRNGSGGALAVADLWQDNKIHRHSPPLKTQKTPKNGKKRLFSRDWERPVSGSLLLCKPLCLRGFKVVRDTGFEPVTPTVSR